jgi:hypothetical protein
MSPPPTCAICGGSDIQPLWSTMSRPSSPSTCWHWALHQSVPALGSASFSTLTLTTGAGGGASAGSAAFPLVGSASVCWKEGGVTGSFPSVRAFSVQAPQSKRAHQSRRLPTLDTTPRGEYLIQWNSPRDLRTRNVFNTAEQIQRRKRLFCGRHIFGFRKRENSTNAVNSVEKVLFSSGRQRHFQNTFANLVEKAFCCKKRVLGSEKIIKFSKELGNYVEAKKCAQKKLVRNYCSIILVYIYYNAPLRSQ